MRIDQITATVNVARLECRIPSSFGDVEHPTIKTNEETNQTINTPAKQNNITLSFLHMKWFERFWNYF